MSGDGFLSRWSRRKRGDLPAGEPEAEAAPAPASAPEPAAGPGAPPAPDDAPAEPSLSEEELAALPPLESIDAATDIAAFMRAGVPTALRNAALRRFWSANPLVRDYLDPAREYAYDWNTPGGVPGDGPLAPGFDARALADRIFGKRQEAVAQPAEDVRETPDPSAQSAQHNGDTATPEASDDAERETPGTPEIASAPGVPVHSDGFRSAQTTIEPRDSAPRPRRHGRATPV